MSLLLDLMIFISENTRILFHVENLMHLCHVHFSLSEHGEHVSLPKSNLLNLVGFKSQRSLNVARLPKL